MQIEKEVRSSGKASLKVSRIVTYRDISFGNGNASGIANVGLLSDSRSYSEKLMIRRAFTSILLVLIAGVLVLADEPTFKSDVALTRVDAQVLDRDGRAVTGLEARDFVLRVNGQPVQIRNFASENMPIDILLLLDVSGSMEPHVERIASAAQQALNVLADKDRVAIMVFDTSTRVRLPFRSSHSDVTRELDRLLRSESFNGGTRITSSLISAARYVERALANANAVLSFLQAPYEPPNMNAGGGRPRRGGTWGGGGGGIGFPGGGGGIGFPGGGIGFPGGGMGRGGGGYGGGGRSHSAGTATIAQDSGGDTMQVDEASALEDTLARLRQRYALHFYLPEGMTAADRQSVRVDLSQDARLRYQDAEVRSRRVFMSGGAAEKSAPTVVARGPAPGERSSQPATTASSPGQTQSSGTQAGTSDSTTPKRRSVAVNEDSGSPVNTVIPDETDVDTSQPAKHPASQTPPQPAPKGGWPKANQETSNPQ